jgi:anti-sigma B factor antagonist
MEFSITLTADPPAATIAPIGDLDVFSAFQVVRRLVTASTAGYEQLHVDLAGITFVDASALGVLDRAVRRWDPAEHPLDFTGATPSFRHLCELTDLQSVFDLN